MRHSAPCSMGTSAQLETSTARFQELVDALVQEHAAVVRERDALRSDAPAISPPPFAASWGGPCAAEAPGRLSPRRADDGSAKAPVAPPCGDQAPPAKAGHSFVAVGASHRTSLQIAVPSALQQVLQHRRQRGSLPAAVAQKGAGVRRAAPDALKTRLELEPRWRDLYLANENEAEVECDATRAFKAIIGQEHGQNSTVMEEALQKAATGRRGCQQVSITPTGLVASTWDLLGMAIVICEAVRVPMSAAWGFDDPGAAVRHLTSVFWILDVLVRFNTGFFSPEGAIVMQRRHVAKHYALGWFPLDLIVIVLESMAPLQSGFAMVKLARLVKVGRVSRGLEDLLAQFGALRMILVWKVFETAFVIFLITHWVACAWYYIGWVSWSADGESWLKLLGDPTAIHTSELYVRCLYWVLGHVVAAPVDALIAPQNLPERVFTVCAIFSSLLIVGTGISKMTNAIAEMNRASAEARDLTRKLRQVLRASGVDRATSSRIVRFALHSHRRRCDLAMDEGLTKLLSKTLASELTLCQRGTFLKSHDMFTMIRDGFPEVYPNVCSAFRTNLYADDDLIFGSETLSEVFYVTLRGMFVYKAPQQAGTVLARSTRTRRGSLSLGVAFSSEASLATAGSLLDLSWQEDGYRLEVFDRPRYLCEVALFAKSFHQSELRTGTFADALTLTGADLAGCMRASPKCIGVMYRYAQALLACVSEQGLLNHDIIPNGVARQVRRRLQTQNMPTSLNFDSPSVDEAELRDFLGLLAAPVDRDPSARRVDLPALVVRVFGELDRDEGIYSKIKQVAERGRAMSSLVSFACLTRNDYDGFVEDQPEGSRLSRELWDQLQRFVAWTELRPDEVHAMAVFLIVRGLGKTSAFLKALPPRERSEEQLVMRLLTSMPRQAPSAQLLGQEQVELIEKSLTAHAGFNLAQFLQGENAPHHLQNLKIVQEEHGDRVMKFSLFALVCFMCGIRGAESPRGSLFMNQAQASTMAAGLSVLRKLEQSSPLEAYWTYIQHRASQIDLPLRDAEDLAVARLACLTRTSKAELWRLQSAWGKLSSSERHALTRHFIADGIEEPTFMFMFLPKYLLGAMANNNVGLSRAFVVLIDLLERLEIEGFVERMGLSTVNVNLKDLGDFVTEVASPAAFAAVMVHASILQTGVELYVSVSTKHRQSALQMDWADEPGEEMRAILRRMNRRVNSVGAAIESVSLQAQPSVFGHPGHETPPLLVSSDASTCADEFVGSSSWRLEKV